MPGKQDKIKPVSDTFRGTSFAQWKREHPNVGIDLEDNPEKAWRDHMAVESVMKIHKGMLSERTKRMIEFVNSKPNMPLGDVIKKAKEILGQEIMRWKRLHQDPDSVPEFKEIGDVFLRLEAKVWDNKLRPKD
ncbi:MAG: hypothetical protein Q7S08_01645 [bacterium]|nr:hypothetical protein [bacterium]